MPTTINTRQPLRPTTSLHARSRCLLLPALWLIAAPLTAAPAGARPPDPAEAQVIQNLDAPMSVDWTAIPLDRALERWAAASRCAIEVDWNALARAKLDRLTPLDAHYRDLPAGRVLALLLSAAGGELAAPGYTVEGDTVKVPGVRSGDGGPAPVNVVYAVADLLRVPARPRVDADEMSDRLTRLIQENIDPDSWRDNGGSLGAMAARGDKLIVTTSPAVHREIERLLAGLRAALAGKGPPTDVVRDRVRRSLKQPTALPAAPATLWEAVDAWRRATGLNVWFDRRAAEADGIDPDAPVRPPAGGGGGAQERPAGEVLQALLDAAGDDDVTLGFEVDADGVVTIATAEDLGALRQVGFYNVRRLLEGDHLARRPWPRDATAAERIESLTRLIQETIEPETWVDNGGSSGAVTAFGSVLIVTQTPGNQEKVAALLRQL